MEEAINEFGKRLGQGGVGLFFYAGHGIQSGGHNYLIPIGAKLKRDKDLKYKTIDIGMVLDEMKYANNGLNIAILDACRNNPLTRSFRSASRGLARIDEAPKGLLLAYSTAPGEIAADGEGRNSPYTRHMLKAMMQDGLQVEQAFKKVMQKVKQETGGKQVPWISSSFTGDFYFLDQKTQVSVAPTIVASVKPVPIPQASTTNSQVEMMYWDSINDLGSIEYFKAYLVKYPDGQFADLAKLKIAQLGKTNQSVKPKETNNTSQKKKYVKKSRKKCPKGMRLSSGNRCVKSNNRKDNNVGNHGGNNWDIFQNY